MDFTVAFSCFRAIFLWLCSKDLAELAFDNIQKGSPEEILVSLRQSQTTYAVVYETLCRLVQERLSVHNNLYGMV